MNSESISMIRRSNGISPNIAQPKTDDFMFFVLRSKASTFEDATPYEDIFCVVQDSYADRINKDNTLATTRTQRKPSTAERISSTNVRNLPLEPISLWNTRSIDGSNLPFELQCSSLNTNEQTKNNNNGSNMKATFNLKLFRDYLMCFEVHPNSSISYMDNKHKLCPLQTETEFLELWKFAKSCAEQNKAVLLLVDLTNSPDDMINSNNKISTVNDQKNFNIDNANIPDNFQSKETMIEVKDSNMQNSNKPFNRHSDCETFTPVSNLTTSCSRIFTKENSDVKLESTVPSNINSQDCLKGTPPIWFVQYMEQFKQDIIKEVSDQVMVNVQKHLNECPMKSSGHAQLENAVQSETQVYNHRSKSNRQKNNLLIDQKRQYKGAIVKTRKKKEKKLEDKLEYNSEDDNTKEKTNNDNEKYNISKFMDNTNSIFMSNNTTTINKTVNNHDSMPPDFLESQRSSKENLYEPNVANVKEGSEFRMNCSITEHQMLDKTNFKSETCRCGCDTENISLCSDISNEEDASAECNFEMIQKPSHEEVKRFFMKNKGKSAKDHSGFCLLPKMSPSQASTICIDEDHFTANLNIIPTSSKSSVLNIPNFYKSNDKEGSVRDNINTKVHSECTCNMSNKSQGTSIKDLTNSICEKLIESSLVPTDNEINTEFECSNATNLKNDVNDSHTSYMTAKPVNVIYSESPETQHIYESPTNLNDLTLSFHSHTTSIADDGIYFKASDHDYTKPSASTSSKPTNSNEDNTCEQIKKDITNKNPDNKMSREKSNGKSSKHVNEDTAAKPAEPVHILPETLVTGALHLASFAYGTAREAIVKIRTNSKDGRAMRARRAARY